MESKSPMQQRSPNFPQENILGFKGEKLRWQKEEQRYQEEIKQLMEKYDQLGKSMKKVVPVEKLSLLVNQFEQKIEEDRKFYGNLLENQKV